MIKINQQVVPNYTVVQILVQIKPFYFEYRVFKEVLNHKRNGSIRLSTSSLENIWWKSAKDLMFPKVYLIFVPFFILTESLFKVFIQKSWLFNNTCLKRYKKLTHRLKNILLFIAL